MICIPITASGNLEMAETIRRAEREPADMYELRLDHLDEAPDLRMLLAAGSRPVIATCRSPREGGQRKRDEEDRIAVLQASIDAGADFVDVEADSIGKIRRRGKTRVIASWHDFSRTPADLTRRISEMERLPADWIKFAVMARRPADNLAVFSALAAAKKPAIGLAMGEFGVPSRVLALRFGSRLTFGSLAADRESAPGQPTARDLAFLYRAKRITGKTGVYGVIGNPIAQSLGPVMHNHAFMDKGMDAVYLAFLAEDAEDFLSSIPDPMGIRGLSVTMPHKHAALAWAKTRSPLAERIGAANTLVRLPGGWMADNTDAGAAGETVAEAAGTIGLGLAGANALVLGAGGAAKAIGAGLSSLGCAVSVANRGGERAESLAKSMGWRHIDLARVHDERWDIVANATSVGMAPNDGDTPFHRRSWRKGMVALDAVYHPRLTRFLREAGDAGAAIAGGMDMFIRQGASQFELWTGEKAPMETMRRSLEREKSGLC